MTRPKTDIVRIAVAPEQQGTIKYVPFIVPPNTARVAIKLLHVPPAPNVIDLGMADPSRIRGWSGGARQWCEITPEWATPGYLKGPLPSGTWHVLLGLYRLLPESHTLVVEIEIEPFSPRWVPGDLHVHSIHSDGALSLDELVSHAIDLDLQFLAITDHNTFSQNFEIPAMNAPITLIPAMEWTTFKGHANIWGVADPLPDWRASTEAEVGRKRDAAMGKGALVSINHPFDAFQPGIRWDWNMKEFPCVEIWNGPWRPTNQASLHWWDEQLRQGQRITAVGGSDFHRPGDLVHLGEPTTWVWAESAGRDGIIEGIRCGNVFVSADRKCPEILNHGEVRPWTKIAGHDGTLALSIEKLTRGHRVRVFDETGLVSEAMADEREMAIPVHPHTSRYLRIEVHEWHREWEVWMPQLLTNPIYFDQPKEL